MKVEITTKFKKQLDSCSDLRLRKKVATIIESTIKANSVADFHNLKKLTIYKNRYRIRLGNYRIGLHIDQETVIFAAFDHRSKIYKYFP